MMADAPREETHEIMVPSEYLGDHECKVGDTYKVTAKDEDGITLQYVGSEQEEERSEGPMEGMDRYFEEKGGGGEAEQGGY